MMRSIWNRQNNWGHDPFAELRQLERQVNQMFRDVHGRGTDYPSLNYWSNEDAAYIEVEMPGVDQKDFDLTVTNDVVTIAGERKDPFDTEQHTAHRHERAFGSFSRTLQLPFDIEADQVKARYENGVLRVTLPRRESSKSKRIAIHAS